MKKWWFVDGVWLYGDKKLTCYKAAKTYCQNRCDRKTCMDLSCPLFAFRDGKNPNRHKSLHQPRNAKNGKFSSVYTGKKRILLDVSKGIIQLPDGEYELVKKR